MTKSLEEKLRQTLADSDSRYDARIATARLSRYPYHSRSKARRMWAAVVAAAGTVIAAAVIGGALLLSSDPTLAYAGWSAVPAAATQEALQTATDACNLHPAHLLDAQSSTPGTEVQSGLPVMQAFTGTPVLAETRGIYTAVISVTNGQVFDCMADESSSEPYVGFMINAFGAVQAAPGDTQISVPYTGQNEGGRVYEDTWTPLAQTPNTAAAQQAALARILNGGYGTSVLGQAGAGVTGVSFTFPNGAVVQATVDAGWYFAWSPWTSQPSSVTVTSTAGTVSSQLTGTYAGFDSSVLRPGCEPGSGGCVFSSGGTSQSTVTTDALSTTTGTTDDGGTPPSTGTAATVSGTDTTSTTTDTTSNAPSIRGG